MEANELMIGDWVQGFLPDTYSQVVGVLNEYRVAIIACGKGAYMELSVDDIQAVPLTPEILEKNGFKVVHGFGYCENYPTYGWGYHKGVRDYAFVDVTFYGQPIAGVSTLVRMETNSSMGDGINKFHSCDCDYVHQLQHALRLCGIEKEIEL